MDKGDKTICVSEDVYKKLVELKKEKGYKTFSEVIRTLILYYRILELKERVGK